MTNSSFVVTVSVDGVKDCQIWNGEQEFGIGFPFRWVMERTEDGVVVRNIGDEHGKAGSVVRQLDEKALDKGACVKLHDSFSLDIKPVVRLPAAFATHEGQTGELRVYSCRDQWTTTSERVDESYVARAEGGRVFTVAKAGSGRFAIKCHVDGLVLTHEGHAAFAKGEERKFEAKDLIGTTLTYGRFQWKLDTLKRTALARSDERVPLMDADFRRAFQPALAALGVLILAALFWPKPKTDDVVPPQVTHIVLKKLVPAHMTAAATGSSRATDFATGTHIEHRHHKGTEHIAKAAPRHSVSAPKVAHAAPARHETAKATGHPGHAAKHVAAARVHSTHVIQPHVVAHAGAAKAGATAHASAHSVARAMPTPQHPALTQKPTVAQKRPVSHDALNHTELAQLLNDAEFKKEARGVVHGGMSQLLAKGQLARGTDGRKEAGGILRSDNELSDSSGGGSESIGTRQVKVASLGGGEGIFGSSSLGYGKGSHARVAGQGHSFVSLDTAASDVEEGLSKDQVGAVIHKHESEIRYCYESAMLRSPDIEGKLAVHFVIGAPGAVKAANVRATTLGDRQLDDCVMRRLVTWQFPHPRGGVDVAVNYPFIFKTLGR